MKVSGGGTSPKGVVAHYKYLNRRPELEIETDDGEHLQGRGQGKGLVEDWDLEFDAAESQSAYSGTPGRKPAKLVQRCDRRCRARYNCVFSKKGAFARRPST